jgi:serine/threonine protein kinase
MTHKENKELLGLIETEYFKQRYLFSRLIGRGGFGVVIEARPLETPEKTIAVKMIKSGKQFSRLEHYVKSEVKIHGSVSHPNIVNFLGVEPGH